MLFRDTDGLAALFADWGMECQQLSRRPGENWVVSAVLPGLKFRSTAASGRHRVKGWLPAGDLVMSFDLDSGGVRRFDGHATGGDEIVVGFGGAEFDYVSPDHHRGMNFSLPEAVVVDALARRAPGAERLMHAGSVQVMSSCGPQTAVIRALANAAFGLQSQPFGLHVPEFAHVDMLDALIGTLLSPWNRALATTVRAPHYQRMPIVRRVEAFMRANLGEPIMLHDICQAARASERAVGYAFHDVYGVGAKQYLKLLRLNQVRHWLKALPAEAATITAIAGRYGFWHMGHFSTDYRRLFGETPHQTRGQQQSGPEFPEPPASAATATGYIPGLVGAERASRVGG